MKSLLIYVVLLGVSSSAFGSDKKLQDWLGAGSWDKGTEYCNGKLADDVSRRPDLRNTSTEYLARLAVYCAALASGKGDERSASWWWYTAASIDLRASQDLLPEMRKMGLLEVLPPPRSRRSPEAHELKKDEVRLLTGEIVSGTSPRLLTKVKIPEYMFQTITGVSGAVVVIEAVISKDGIPQQPLLLNAKALPVHVLWAYQFFSAFRFEPAKVNDEPVECIYAVTISTQRE